MASREASLMPRAIASSDCRMFVKETDPAMLATMDAARTAIMRATPRLDRGFGDKHAACAGRGGRTPTAGFGNDKCEHVLDELRRAGSRIGRSTASVLGDRAPQFT